MCEAGPFTRAPGQPVVLCGRGLAFRLCGAMGDRLVERIALHRQLVRDELTFNPSQSRPPVAYAWDESERAMVPDDRPLVITPPDGGYIEVPDSATHSTHVGVPMSARMLRYLAGPSADTPWSSALKSLRAHCRRNHPYHRAADRPYWRGSLCWQMVYLVIIGKPKGDGPASIGEAGEILRYDAPEPVLREALEYIEQQMDRMQARAERRAREDEGHGPGPIATPLPVHHTVPGLHEQECPQCRKRRIPA